MATFVGRLKSSGVTSVVLLADPPTVSTIMKSTATEQDYFPEWIYTGFGFRYGLYEAQQRRAADGAHVRPRSPWARSHRQQPFATAVPVVLGHDPG